MGLRLARDGAERSRRSVGLGGCSLEPVFFRPGFWVPPPGPLVGEWGWWLWLGASVLKVSKGAVTMFILSRPQPKYRCHGGGVALCRAGSLRWEDSWEDSAADAEVPPTLTWKPWPLPCSVDVGGNRRKRG